MRLDDYKLEDMGGFLGPKIGDALLIVIGHCGGCKYSMAAAKRELYSVLESFRS